MIDELIKKIEKVGRFESLVQMPEKKDPDWKAWAARGTKNGHGVSTFGDTPEEALEEVLEKLKK